MASSQITLYDVEMALKEKTLSPFAVRLRLLLDYKNIAYDSVWLGYPDVEATAKAVGAPPTRINSDGNPGYTIPFITVSSPGKPTLALSDSVKIAQYIEEMFPDSQGRLLPQETRVFQSIFTKYMLENVLSSITGLVLKPFITLLPTHTQDWFIKTRETTYGKSIEELVPQDESRVEKAWECFDAAFDDLASHLDRAGEGNYRISGGVSYAEFELVSILNFIKKLSPDDGWKRLEKHNGGRWAKLMDEPVYKRLLLGS